MTEESNNKDNNFVFSLNIKSDKSNQVNNHSTEMILSQCMTYFLQGKRAYEANNTDKAIELFQQAIKFLEKGKINNSDSAIFYTYLGLSAQKKGWHSFANAQFLYALKLNPKDEVAKNNVDLYSKNSMKKVYTSDRIRDFLKKIFKNK